MDFSTCYNCGEAGHFARDCESPAISKRLPKTWQNPPRREDQAEINRRGIALCREALANRE